MFAWLKRSMPRSLYGRAALILLLPVLSLQLIIGAVFIQRHFDGVTRQMTQGIVTELALVQRAAERQPGDVQALGAALGMQIGMGAAVTDRRVFYDVSGRVVTRTLRAGLSGVGGVDLGDPRRVRLALDSAAGPLEVSFARRRVSASNPHQLLVIMGVLGALMTLIAYIFLRNQLRPIRRLGRAAQEYGRGRVLPYRLAGATEVRAAGAAFLDMRARLERQGQARRLMLSGISHDLRTPLTRMRLELSLMDPASAAPLLRDVQDMERLVDGFLDFARGDAGEPSAPTDPVALLRAAVRDAGRLGPVELGGAEAPEAVLRPVAVRRALDNLLGNALRHGTRARAGVSVAEGLLRFWVEDDGPGIPADQRAEAMRPFVRLDPARNQDKGPGVGLGLAIVADIARSHGGRLDLGESAALGGLRAELVVPL